MVDPEWKQIVHEINADFKPKADQLEGKRSSESNIVDIFLAETRRLRRIIAGMGLSVSDGEDILQDVSIQALKQCGEYRSPEQAVQWLIKVTVNRCLVEYRRRRRFRRKTSEILKRLSETKARPTTADEKVIVAEELEIVRKTLQELDGSLLAPMVLRYFCNMNSKEVGEILNLSSSTVRSRLREARMILAKRLLERGIEP